MYEVVIDKEDKASRWRTFSPPVRSPRKKESKTHLTYSYMGMYCFTMARASTTSDAFNAVAEPRRREILSYLAGAERPVGEIVTALGMEQPSVSKHLRVLRDVGLVRMRCQGRQKLYRTNAEAIRPLHQWSGTFERYWQHQLNRVKERAEAMVRQGASDLNFPSPKAPDPNPKEKR
jgi:DNA-binding transcriptional ArsR family regulator